LSARLILNEFMHRPILPLLALAFCFLAPAALPGKPNVIVIMADDLGYGDVGCYGATALKTPNIDKLAAEGQRFTSGYCSASTCTPTRFSFLTGTYAFRHEGTGIAPPAARAIIKPGTPTLASLLKSAGYQTAVIGKWHLGLGDPEPDWNGELKPGPLEIGFDHCFLLPTTNDRVPQVYLQDHRILNLDPKDPLWVGSKAPSEDHPTGITHRSTLKMDWSHGHNQTIHNGISRIGFYTGGHAARFRDEDLGDEWVKRSNAWIEAHQDKPFFLFFAAHDIHVPRMPHERFHGATTLGFRGDSIVQLDWCMGELMKTLDRLKLAENTLVVYSTDHGDWLGDHGLILKGPMAYEGLLRVGLLMRGPGVPAGKVVADPVSTIDLPRTFADYAGVSLGDARHSRSLKPLIEKDATRDFAYSEWDLRASRCGVDLWLRTVRTGTHKLTLETNSGAGELYDLVNDPQEMDNRFGDPGVAKAQRELEDMIRSRPKDQIDPLPQIGMA